MSDSEPVHPPIAEEQGKEIRRLAHDLANALEVIVQTNYLLGMAELEPSLRQWQQMLDKGVQQATAINRELRDYVRANS